MKVLFLAFLCLSFKTNSQTIKAEIVDVNDGVKFEDMVSWESVKMKALEEDKYIFVDCYTTWCGPCKMMDRDVYSNKIVGDSVSKKFISIKLQMDTSKNDEDRIKQSYPLSKEFREKYRVQAFPTYLFFTPKGVLVHEATGYRTVKDFLDLLDIASNPKKQYYNLLALYKQGNKDIPLDELAILVKESGQKELARQIAIDYKQVLDKMVDSIAFRKNNLLFLGHFPFLISSVDRYFNFLLKHQNETDSILDLSQFSLRFVKNIITREELQDKIYKNGVLYDKTPNWRKIERNIKRKYGEYYSNLIIPGYKLSFYSSTKNWSKYSKLFSLSIKDELRSHNISFDKKIENIVKLNGAAWMIFKKSNKRNVLKSALKWSTLSIELNDKIKDSVVITNIYDTKASILYKLNKKKQAIATEEMAILLEELEQKKHGNNNRKLLDQYHSTLKKMKLGTYIDSH